MAGKQKAQVNEKYLNAVFSMMKKRDGIMVADKKTRFNDTELRLISEVLSAKQGGNRLISTQLATKLGVTRSAISQIVNRLEETGVLKRVPDAVDRKIAYIEVTEETMDSYRADMKTCGDFVGRVVERFGDEKFKQMKGLLEEFMDMMDEERQREDASYQVKKK
jgi:DNA-binding MarR family transcriptional regulator